MIKYFIAKNIQKKIDSGGGLMYDIKLYWLNEIGTAKYLYWGLYSKIWLKWELYTWYLTFDRYYFEDIIITKRGE